MQKTKYPEGRTWIKDFRSYWNVAKFYSYSRHDNQCQRSRQASPLKSVGRDLKTENPPPFFSAGWLQRGNFWSLVNGSPLLSSWWMTLTYWSRRPSPAGQPATSDGQAELCLLPQLRQICSYLSNCGHIKKLFHKKSPFFVTSVRQNGNFFSTKSAF